MSLIVPPGDLQGVTAEELLACLRSSLGHQCHYAGILNQYDGGKRLQFATVRDWIDRLRTLEPSRQRQPNDGETHG